MKYLLTGLLLLLACSCSQKEKKAETRPAPVIPAEWLYLDNDNFSIRYPQTWELQNGNESIEFYLFSYLTSPVGTFRDNVNLVIENLLTEMSPDKYVALSVKNIRDKFNISVADKRKYTVGGQTYYLVKLKWKDGIDLIQHIHMKGKTAYILSLSYESDEKGSIQTEGEKIMASFKVK